MDNMVFWDTIEQLTDTTLVRNDVDNGSLSLHRLVQDECCEGETAALRHVCHFGAHEVSRHWLRLDLWETGLLSIMSIANDWQDSQQQIEPLQSTCGFCNLMANAFFLVEENDPAG